MDGPEVHAPHAPHTGHRWWDFAIGGSAMLVSLVSLYVAFEHGHTMEKLVAANSWPNVSIDVGIDPGDTQDSTQLSVVATNNGIGPARIESLELFFAGKPLKSSSAIIEQIKIAGGGAVIAGRLAGSTIIGNVVGARENTVITNFVARDGARWTVPILKVANGISTRVCYCSVFDECYIDDSRVRAHRPEKIEKCPVPADIFDDRVGDALLKKIVPPPAK